MEILEKMRCGKVKVVKNFGERKIQVKKSGISLPLGRKNFSFSFFKSKEEKMIVEKKKIFQQGKTSDRICIFEFSTSFSTVCGKPDV